MGGFFTPVGSPNACVDLDECTMGMHDCNIDAKCENTVGGYKCNCNEGLFKVGGICRDRDECALGIHNCTENAACFVSYL